MNAIPRFRIVDGMFCAALLVVARPFWLGVFAATVYLISLASFQIIISRRLP